MLIAATIASAPSDASVAPVGRGSSRQSDIFDHRVPDPPEGIARAQIEALASGLPVVGTHEGGATTLVKDGVEGFIVRGRDAHDIAGAMLRIATDRPLNSQMSEAAYEVGARKNTWQDYGDRLLAEYALRMARKQIGSTDF